MISYIKHTHYIQHELVKTKRKTIILMGMFVVYRRRQINYQEFKL